MKNENQMHTHTHDAHNTNKILKLDRFAMNYKLYAAKLPAAAAATAAEKANRKKV